MRNKNICLELKMDRVFYFAARRETDGGWQQMDRKALSSICSSSPSRLLHCWCLRFHCWVLLQESAITQGSKPWGNTGLDENRLNGENHINISYTTKGSHSHMRSLSLPHKSLNLETVSGCPLVGVSSVKSGQYLLKHFKASLPNFFFFFSFWDSFWSLSWN